MATHAVTGAFGFTGRYIARRLLEAGHRVVTLTNSPAVDDPFDGRVPARPLRFDDPAQLAASLYGVRVLHNSYWVRFNYRTFRFTEAVENTGVLLAAARQAGVERIVHISITNPSLDSELEYFRHKARVEAMIEQSGLGYSILRPAVLFGRDGILINNIAWALRQLPLFGVFGDGQYRLQPIHVDDLARLAVEHAARAEPAVVDAIGPETFTYRGLVRAVGEAIGRRRPIVSVPPAVGWAMAKLIGGLVGDVIITRDEIRGLMEERLYVESEPVGSTSLRRWAAANREVLGAHYASELARRRRSG